MAVYSEQYDPQGFLFVLFHRKTFEKMNCDIFYPVTAIEKLLYL